MLIFKTFTIKVKQNDIQQFLSLLDDLLNNNADDWQYEWREDL